MQFERTAVVVSLYRIASRSLPSAGPDCCGDWDVKDGPTTWMEASSAIRGRSRCGAAASVGVRARALPAGEPGAAAPSRDLARACATRIVWRSRRPSRRRPSRHVNRRVGGAPAQIAGTAECARSAKPQTRFCTRSGGAAGVICRFSRLTAGSCATRRRGDGGGSYAVSWRGLAGTARRQKRVDACEPRRPKAAGATDGFRMRSSGHHAPPLPARRAGIGAVRCHWQGGVSTHLGRRNPVADGRVAAGW